MSKKPKILLVEAGDTLWSIAAKEYGRSDLWRRIADANKINNPRMLKPGTKLVIPPLE